MAADPFRDQRGLVFAFDLDHRIPGHLHAAVLDRLVLREGEPRAHARTGRHGRREAHAVQAVVHAHLAIRVREGLLGKVREQRQRQEAVRDGAAERRALRALAIDVDPLEVVDRLGEGVDALLRDLDPGRNADFLADALREAADAQGRHLPTPCAIERAMRARTSGSSMRTSSLRLTMTPASTSTEGILAVLP